MDGWEDGYEDGYKDGYKKSQAGERDAHVVYCSSFSFRVLSPAKLFCLLFLPTIIGHFCYKV